MECCKCKKDKDESGYIFTDFGSESFEGNDDYFICVDCADKIPKLND